MTESYTTIKAPVVSEIIEKKSRFIASLAPAADREQAMAHVESVKKKYHDARHNCYAFVVGYDGSEVKYSDDGEPQGTAGRPMLEVLKGRELVFISAVVTRYFGGILLGTGGLSRAYSGAVSEALAAANIIRMQLGIGLKVSSDYTMTGRLMHVFETRGIKISDVIYDAGVSYMISVIPDQRDALIRELVSQTKGGVSIEETGSEYAEVL